MIKEVIPESCVCGLEVFACKDGEHFTKYEDLAGTIQHTKLHCEMNQIVSKRIQELRIEINQIKERLNL